MDISHASVAEKAALFKQPEQMGAQVPDDFDESEMANRQGSRSFFRPGMARNPPPTPHGRGRQEHRRVSSAPTPGKRDTPKVIKGTPASVMARRNRLTTMLDGNSTSVDETTTIPASTRPAVKAPRRSDSTPLPAAKRSLLSSTSSTTDTPTRAAAGSKRRKRGASPVKRPEEEQILKGLTFFYVPDNDIALARRMRISKAREYGATWTRMVSAATHIVVDRCIKYKELESTLARTEKSRPPKVVNEDYPIDCIQFKSILDHNQKRYQLVGQPVPDKRTPENSEELPASSEESGRSLQVKPPPKNPRRWDYVPPAGTPSRSEESSQLSRVAGTPAPTDSQPITLDMGPVAASPEAMSPTVEEDPPQDAGNQDILIGTSQSEPIANRRSTTEAARDELSEYISMMQEYKGLPLDVDEEDESRSVAGTVEAIADPDEQSGSDGERARKTKVTVRTGRKITRFEDRFSCNQAGAKDLAAGNPNARTIEVLQNMANYYDRVNDHWRTTAYRKAINTLKRQDARITTEEEAFRLPMIGRRLAQKIEEIVTTDRLQRLEYAEAEPTGQSLQLFTGIYGVGTGQAQHWIAQGFRTLDDLKQKVKLSTTQLIGIEHYDEFNQRIPRAEVEALGALIQKAAARIDPRVQVIIGGSYRRGAESSGDIDLIVTKPGTESTGDLVPFLDKLVQRLEQDKFLVARLASSRPGHDGSKWHGCCVLPRTEGVNDGSVQDDDGDDGDDGDNDDRRPWRRIDFLLVPESEMGAALIYFTGNDIFNRSMRLLASKKGMRLNQRGLYGGVMGGPARTNRARAAEGGGGGQLLEGRNERRIFEILGVQWREPHERWC
ncbi:DNA polymerase lambda-like protein [Hapsidospora chrysogenum ATCC 11550]|uniref:DNA polymerase lambda n=1 Tax=Hapsidospora chrysogenum (strain ATCC 11550 / CBS 779.69 / DSM 880 / IAM 14645 / JCM 23072 / IMI 49137) TaxID=857340 RepID=A0A086SXT2_HAPC1|nr:DNA polymerase lambda-like protein [Hapsidospora chrysogenum ATCC 11550]